jgi:hypothetical protein
MLRYVVTVVCAASAGVHAALVRPHMEEAGILLGAAFAVASFALAGAALAVRQPRHDAWAPATAAAVLCLIAVSYLLSRTSGLPVLIASPEGLDPLGGITTAAEVVGAAAAIGLQQRKDT